MHPYLLRSGDGGAQRLFVLASAHEPATRSLFERLALAGDARCLDVGCGVGAVTELLAKTFAGAGGSALGVDIDDRYLEVARASAAGFGDRIAYRKAAAHELDFVAEYDVVYSRFLLSHLREPEQVLRRMIRAVKPGGTIAIEDVDFGGAFCHPPCRDFDRYLAWYDEMTRGNGADPNLGRGLFAMVRGLGVADIQFSVAQPAFNDGPAKHLAPTTLEHIGHVLVERNIASVDELNAATAGLRAYAEDATTVLSMPRVFQVWGRVV
jgi:SAM-dependent methyltransferase